MKINLFLFATLIAFLTFTSCDKDEKSFGFIFGQNFELAFDQSAISTDGTVEVHFKSVESDSRCPSDVICIWAGEASIALTISMGNTDVDVTLSTHPDFGPVDTVDQYIFTLVNLAPYPISSQQYNDEDYSAELLVEKL